MGEKNLWSKVGLIALLVGLCFWQCWPLSKLKPGIDLGGGHSLIFEIDDTGQKGSPDLAERVMAVLRKRVDPQGTMNLVWRPIGRNRLEIQMPNPSSDQQGARLVYRAAREALAETYLQDTMVRDTLNVEPAQRDELYKAMSEYVMPDIEAAKKNVNQIKYDKDIPRVKVVMEKRHALLQELVHADERYKELNSTTTKPVGEAAKESDQLLIERRTTLDRLLQTNLNESRVIDILELGAKSSDRAERLAKLKEGYPDLASLIDTLTEAYDSYAGKKGVLDDPADLMRMIRGAGVLEFRILAQRSTQNTSVIASNVPVLQESIAKYTDQLQKRGPRKAPSDQFAWYQIEEGKVDDFSRYIIATYLDKAYVLAHESEEHHMALLHHDPAKWSLKSARQDIDQQGRPSVNFSLDNRGGSLFGEMTGNNIHGPLCIFLDKVAISAATIQSRISNSGQITGDFGLERVRYLVNTLEAGSLPERLKEVPLQQKSVGPTLGSTNQQKGKEAIAVAFLATIVFMILYYGYCGVIADIALLMNLVITLGIMAFIDATFTLPGIAGLVLTLGMAVDANVLIYERIREELQRGVSAKMAIKLGYEKAFSAILDSNVTTIITAVILGSIGSEEIKGFGLTLGIGMCTSLFTALFVTRQFFNIMTPNRLDLEETKKAWGGSIILSLAGGLLFGLGYAFNKTQELRDESTLYGFGNFLLTVGVAALLLLAFMWIFRTVYHASGHQKANRLPMMKLFSAPNIDWMGKHRIFWTISAVIIVGGFVIEAGVDSENYLDIEFLGGTNASVTLNAEAAAKPEYAEEGDTTVTKKIGSGGSAWLSNTEKLVRNAKVSVSGDRATLTFSEPLNASQVKAVLLTTMETMISPEIEVEGNVATLAIKMDDKDQLKLDEAKLKTELIGVADYLERAIRKVAKVSVQVNESDSDEKSFDLITTETNAPLVAEAVLVAMGGELQMTQKVAYKLMTDPQRAIEGIYPIAPEDDVLSDVIGGESSANIAEHKGGFVFVFDELNPPLTEDEFIERFTEVIQQPEYVEVNSKMPTAIGLKSVAGEKVYTKMAVVSHDSVVRYVEGDEDANADWRSISAQQLELVQAALESESAFSSLTAFAPQVAGEASQKAIIAILLSMLAIAGYLWIRFGSIEFGMAGIIALYHDVAITLSAVMACHSLYDTPIGHVLGLKDFRIDLAMIAAFLTIVGYSINDSIVIFDRIRENRGRLATVSSRLINNSINQTLSRTLITSFTTFLAVLMMYLLGGDGIHGFAFAMLVGVLSGTYSTIAIATPMIQSPRVMWCVSMTLLAVTGIALAMNIDTKFLQIGLIVIVLGIAGLGLWKQVALGKTNGTKAATA